MRRLLFILTVLAWSLPAHAQSTAEMSVVIDTSERVKLDGPINTGTCDDTDIVQIDSDDAGVKLKGLKLGVTHCGFWTRGTTHHWLVTVTVVEPPVDNTPHPRDDPNGGERKGTEKPDHKGHSPG